MRIAGAQIPVTQNLDSNVETIKNSIDWAEQNNCNYLVTPEASLSGYDVDAINVDTNFFKVSKALDVIRKYASDKHIGLILGTLWVENKELEKADVRNQQRYYDPKGNFLGAVNKRYIVSYDEGCVAGEDTGVIHLPIDDEDFGKTIKVTGMLCNDLWGGYWSGKPNLVKVAVDEKTKLIIHSSNGAKDKGEPARIVHDKYHTGCLSFMAYASNIPILTVDNCIHIDGKNYDGETASPSGVFLPLEQVVEVPRKGTQHFYYDMENL